MYLLAVAFLVVGIATTALTRQGGQEASVVVGVANETESTYEAEAVVPEKLDRAKQLASMRSKIAALGESFFAEPEGEVVAEVPAVVQDTETARTEPFLCPQYQVDTRVWNPGPVAFSVVEGARLVTHEVEVATTTASGTSRMTTETEAILQLPLRSVPFGDASCLPTDVVGIAKDGSLIRNSEVKLYTIFGADTLIGYALDGFPIYGAGSGVALDECGGTRALGQYRYYLEAERGHILNCFASEPISI